MPPKKFLNAFECIFRKAMKAGKLNVALRVQEILCKIHAYGWENTSKNDRPLSEWSDEEIKNFIANSEK